MKLKQKYKDINDTLRHMKIQIQESIPFADNVVPNFSTPEELFYWMKKKVRYKKDPSDTELLQTMPTMFLGKYWGIPGAGDCDCFVISTLASMISLGWDDLFIALVGREKKAPVHIYTVIYWKGKRKVFDLTNRDFNYERDNYNYIQELPVPWRNWKKIQFNNN